MFRGIAPHVLFAQVRNTATWALDAAHTQTTSWCAALARAQETTQEHDETWAYFTLLLAAHFATVATFVPTDVDSHIRHHVWQHTSAGARLRGALDALDATDHWDARDVSARVIDVPAVGRLSGHDGEWMAVRAGALGRALALDDREAIERVVARLDEDVARHARAATWISEVRGRTPDALRVAVTIAHNLGDLSRVVEVWPTHTQEARTLAQRYVRLTHEGGDARFAVASRLNKQLMAVENHRFHALRSARALRISRALLLPIGPFFDDWGATVATSATLRHENDGRASVVAALIESHLQGPTQLGVLRALVGFHDAHSGGLDALIGDVPARLRKHLKGGPVREALGVSRAQFEARMARRAEAIIDGRDS
jgi:hypothetical protein